MSWSHIRRRLTGQVDVDDVTLIPTGPRHFLNVKSINAAATQIRMRCSGEDLKYHSLADGLVSEPSGHVIKVADQDAVLRVSTCRPMSTVAAVAPDLIAYEKSGPSIPRTVSESLLTGSIEGPSEEVAIHE